MSSLIGYRGKVTIKMKNKPAIVLHNKGSSKLFEALTKALIIPYDSASTSYTELVNAMPHKVQIYGYPSGEDALLQVTPQQLKEDPTKLSYQLFNPMPIVRSDAVGGATPYVRYSFYLTYSNLWSGFSGTSVTDLANNSYLVLLDAENNILATTKIDLSNNASGGLNITGWSPAQQAAITWELSFTNVASATATPSV